MVCFAGVEFVCFKVTERWAEVKQLCFHLPAFLQYFAFHKADECVAARASTSIWRCEKLTCNHKQHMRCFLLMHTTWWSYTFDAHVLSKLTIHVIGLEWAVVRGGNAPTLGVYREPIMVFVAYIIILPHSGVSTACEPKCHIKVTFPHPAVNSHWLSSARWGKKTYSFVELAVCLVCQGKA